MAIIKSITKPDHTTQARPPTNGSGLSQTTAISARLPTRATTTVPPRRAIDPLSLMVDTMAQYLLIRLPVIPLTMWLSVTKLDTRKATTDLTATCTPIRIRGTIGASRRPPIITTGATLNSPKPYLGRHYNGTVNYTKPHTDLGAFLPGQRGIQGMESNTATTVKMVPPRAPDKATRRGSASLATEPRPDA
jgi:hypothetical protein